MDTSLITRPERPQISESLTDRTINCSVPEGIREVRAESLIRIIQTMPNGLISMLSRGPRLIVSDPQSKPRMLIGTKLNNYSELTIISNPDLSAIDRNDSRETVVIHTLGYEINKVRGVKHLQNHQGELLLLSAQQLVRICADEVRVEWLDYIKEVYPDFCMLASMKDIRRLLSALNMATENEEVWNQLIDILSLSELLPMQYGPNILEIFPNPSSKTIRLVETSHSPEIGGELQCRIKEYAWNNNSKQGATSSKELLDKLGDALGFATA